MAIEGRPPIYEGGDYRRLGPDPEPLGARFEVLMRREQSNAFTARSAPRRGWSGLALTAFAPAGTRRGASSEPVQRTATAA